MRLSAFLTVGTILVAMTLFGACSNKEEGALVATVSEPSPALQQNPAAGGASAHDDEEQRLLELRRLAMEAEASMAGGGMLGGGLAISIEELDAMANFPGNLGPLPAEPEYPPDNHPTEARIELGRKLYFDRRLSRDRSMSCATCHDPEKGWADGRKRAVGFGQKELGRHSPTVINTAYNTAHFWDGRADTLEAQVVGPIMAAGEMSMQSTEDVLDMIRNAPEYDGAFEAAYGSGPSMGNIGRAIAAFERQVVTGPSPFDKYAMGDKSALAGREKRGLILFMTTASCTACHNGPNFTDNKFHALGVRQEGPLSEDLGRFEVTKNPKDKHGFKTPGLRNIEQTAPYMHDGSLATLEEVVEFYDQGGERGDIGSDLIQPLNLTESQKADVVAFLRALTGPLPEMQVPEGEYFGQ